VTAFGRLERALGELELLGVPTNAAFSRELLGRPDVLAGEQDTGLLERALSELELAPDDLPAAAAAIGRLGDAAGLGVPPGPWHRSYEGVGDIAIDGDRIRIGEQDRSLHARAIDAAHALVGLDGVARVYAYARDGDSIWVARDAHVFEARPELRSRSGPGAAADTLAAPMPGTVLAVHVANGDEVAEGDVLLVLESMKMELQVSAPHAGTVSGLELAPGDRVEPRQALLEVVPAEDPGDDDDDPGPAGPEIEEREQR
jgi:acetyl-CoA/propionyl-CoA carboxylase biotin carboxyl carrier protein